MKTLRQSSDSSAVLSFFLARPCDGPAAGLYPAPRKVSEKRSGPLLAETIVLPFGLIVTERAGSGSVLDAERGNDSAAGQNAGRPWTP